MTESSEKQKEAWEKSKKGGGPMWESTVYRDGRPIIDERFLPDRRREVEKS